MGSGDASADDFSAGVQTLQVSDEVLPVKSSADSLESCFYVLCDGFDGDGMMRVDCRACTALTYFCKCHRQEDSFAITFDKCMKCRADGARHSPNLGITKILKSLHVTCKKQGCPEKLTASDMEEHLQKSCWFNMVKCQEPGCPFTGP
jgi:hypothetical protein